MKALEEGRAPVETRQPEQKKPDAQVVNKDPEPDQAKDPTAWMQWKIRKQDEQLSALTGKTVQTERERELATVETAAVGELQEISKRYMRKNPDYAPAVLFAEREYGKALKMQNPNMSVDDINAFMKKEMLRLSVGWVAKGLDPAEEIYDMCIERFGYVPNSGGRREQQFKEDNGEEARNPTGMRRKSPDLRVVNNNRRRSASPLQGSGQGGSPHMSKEAAADMTLGEMAQFDQADWDALERMG
jgi:hypothetical protein